ncbi:pyruvate, water dikinase regulatory protein [Priestia megaterium]|uniref:pyruvate, water dikinase regulatory protein n=1 Tax=Priestia megaterium TaxID=1404 RepID=UPI002FFDD863
MNNPCLYVISDSVGETAELVVKAASSQFNMTDFVIKRVPYVEDIATLSEVVSVAKMNNAIIGFTLVKPEMREFLIQEASKNGVEVFDIIGPLIDKIQSSYQLSPRYEPGMARKLDEDYFKKVEAIEFAVKYDDGRDPRGILRADIVLIGVSRTSKTPLSMYLAHKRFKVANIPLVPEIAPPDELFSIPRNKCVGLIITPDKLNEIRKERLRNLGLTSQANYANFERILEELEYAEKIMKRIGCPVINVSNKAVEETADLILAMLKKERSWIG